MLAFAPGAAARDLLWADLGAALAPALEVSR
jgi:hypothetical protein